MTGDSLARRSLALDAAYCAATGTIAFAGRRQLSDFFGVRASVLGAIGAVTIGWASLVGVLACQDDWRKSARLVGVANTIAAAGLAAAAMAQQKRDARLLVLAVAGEVGTFALSQAVALGRRR